MNRKVLFVDDDAHVLDSVYRNFRKRYQLDTASGGPQALRAMEEHGPYAVVVADMAMPGMNGIEFLEKAQVLAPDTVRIMFTGHPGPVTLLAAINSGQVFRFIAKPCSPEELARAVDAGLAQYRLATAERELLEATLCGAIGAMTGLLELIDPGTSYRARDLADRAGRVARALCAQDAWAITLAALYSPLWLLPLRGREDDPAALAAAVAKAAELVEPIPRLEEVARIIRYLGKGFDGSGLPEGPPRGADLPLGSRILRAVLDFGAVEERVKSLEVALEELRMRTGRYDPRVLAAMATAFGVTLHGH